MGLEGFSSNGSFGHVDRGRFQTHSRNSSPKRRPFSRRSTFRKVAVPSPILLLLHTVPSVIKITVSIGSLSRTMYHVLVLGSTRGWVGLCRWVVEILAANEPGTGHPQAPTCLFNFVGANRTDSANF
jgi:hypothetical protein